MPILKLQHVLVPTDFSKPSRKALKYALSFAQQFGARITLLHVVKPLIIPYDEYPIRELIIDDRGLIKAAKESLSHLCQARRGEPNLIGKRLVRMGSPSEEITKAAGELRADLIIMATRGYSGLKHVFVGSTTERVVRLAPCPVLVVRENEREFASV